MPTNHRQYTRFSLDIPALLCGRRGEKHPAVLQQISVGGCLMTRRNELYPGDEFRLEVELPNGNYLPLQCKAIYRFADDGVGAKFLDLTRFEQELLAKIIEANLEKDGLPMVCDPLVAPAGLFELIDPLRAIDPRSKREVLLEEVMSLNGEG